MKAMVFFYDSAEDTLDGGNFYSLQEAVSEDFVQIKGSRIVPTDACSYIYWYEQNFVEEEALDHISLKSGKPYSKALREANMTMLDMRRLSPEQKSQMLAREMGWEVTSNGLIYIPERFAVQTTGSMWTDSFYNIAYFPVAWLVLRWAVSDKLLTDRDWNWWIIGHMTSTIHNDLVDVQKSILDAIFVHVFKIEKDISKSETSLVDPS